MTESMLESIVSELVVNGGDARSKALEAIRAAKQNEMEKAKELLVQCNESIVKAHTFQTTLIQETLQNPEEEMNTSLIMVHGQDHLMDAMVVRDIAVEMIEMYKEIKELRNEIQK